MDKIKFKGSIINLTHCQPDPGAKKLPAYASSARLTDGNLSYEAGRDPQGKGVTRTYSTVRTNHDIVVDDSHELTRNTSQFIVTGATTPAGLDSQFETAKAHLIALSANNYAELKLRLYMNGADASSLTDASLTAVETAATGA